MQLLGRRYDTGQPVRLEIARDKIARVTPCGEEASGKGDSHLLPERPFGCSAQKVPVPFSACPWIAPGLIDLQVNGYGGVEFSSADLTPEKVRQVAGAMDPFGVTRFCPTLTTEGFEVLGHGLRTIAAVCDSSPPWARRIAAIHLEGPYVSIEDGPRGAHPPQHCRQPDWDEFQRLQEAAGGRIGLLTMAVESDRSPAFIRRVAATGVAVAIGHTSANSAQIRSAVDAGARMSTHLGNGAHAMLHRHCNYIWDQLAEDRLVASLIVDGHHLPPEVVKTFVRAKTPQRCILVSDMVGLAGSPPGRYHCSLGDLEVLPSGRLVVAGQREVMAGASLPIGTGVANVIRFAGVSLMQAVAMAVEHPAQLLGIDPGGLEPGDPADLILFDLGEQFEVRATLVGGEVVFGSI